MTRLMIDSILMAAGLGDSWKQKVQAILTVPYFKEKKRQGRKMFLRQSGERELLLSCCIHLGFPKVTLILPLSTVSHRPSVVQITQPFSGSPPVSAKPDYMYFPFADISSPCSLPYLYPFIHLRWWKLLHSQRWLLSQEQLNPIPPELYKCH